MKREPDASAQVQVLFVVPKKLFRKAHDRNLIRRRIKEAYRVRKTMFYQKLIETGDGVTMALIYTGKVAEEYDLIAKCLDKLLPRIAGMLTDRAAGRSKAD